MMNRPVLPMTPWYGLLVPCLKGVEHAVRNYALLPGPWLTWESDWIGVLPTAGCAEDAGCWPDSVLVKWFAFLGTLHWLAAGTYLGVRGVSYVEMLISSSLGRGRGSYSNFSVGCSVWSRH